MERPRIAVIRGFPQGTFEVCGGDVRMGFGLSSSHFDRSEILPHDTITRFTIRSNRSPAR